jgi:hypothetical protein
MFWEVVLVYSLANTNFKACFKQDILDAGMGTDEICS